MLRTGMMGIVLAAAVAAQDTAPLSSGDKRYTLHVPTAWLVKVEETKGDLRLRLRCEVPDATGKVTVDVSGVWGFASLFVLRAAANAPD